MSFGGGGSTQYRIDYIIKVANEGGVGGINQVKQGIEGVDTVQKQASVSADRMAAANNRVQASGLAVNKAAKGMAFGFIGMTTAGAEFVGMLSMWQQTQDFVKEAVEAQTEALKESGKESQDYKQATQEVAKANRWAGMTFRNLMLSTFDLVPFTVMSINGFMNLKKAMNMRKEAIAARDALQTFGVGAKSVAASTGAMNAAAATSGITLSKFGKGAVIAQGATFKLGTSVVTSTAAMKGIDAAMLSSAIAASKATTAVTATSKAMRVLSIAAKILIPLIAIEIGAQAFANNWGGFADKINAVGKAIGDTIPQMKGFLDIVSKVGRSVVAIFTGDFESIGSIWNPVVEGADEATKVSDKKLKEIEELREAILDLNSAAMDTFGEAAMGDRGEQRDFMKSMGLDKGARKDMAEVLDQFEEIEDATLGLHNALDTMRTLNLMQKFGLDVPNQSWKDIASGLSDIFDNLGDKFPGDDMFDQFSEVMEDASKKKGPAVIKAIMAFMDDNPNFLPFLTAHSPELAANITTMLNEAGMNVDANGMVTNVNKAVQNAFQSGSIIDPNSGEGITTFDKNGKAINTPKGGKGGPLQGVIDGIKNALTALPAQIKAMDWTAVGTAIGESLDTAFGEGGTLAIKVGSFINDNIILPAEGVLRGMGARLAIAAKPWAEEFRKDPIKALFGKGGLTQPVGDFVAGLLGFASEDTMFTFFDIKLFLAAEKFKENFTKYFATQELTKNDPGSGGMDMGQGEGFKNWIDTIMNSIAVGYANLIIALNEDPNVQQFRKWFHDPIGAFIQFIQTVMTSASEVNKKAEKAGVIIAPTAEDFIKDLGIPQFLTDIGTSFEGLVNHIAADPNVKKLKGGLDMLAKGGMDAWNWAMGAAKDLFGGNTAEGAGVSDELINAAGGFNAAEGGINFKLPNVNITPGTITLPPTLPPLAQNITPTITPQSAILTPKTYTVELPGNMPSDPSPGGGGGGFNPWGLDSHQILRMSVPTVQVVPKTYSVDFSQSSFVQQVSTQGETGEDMFTLDSLVVDAKNTFTIIRALWDQVVVAGIADGALALAEHWSGIMNSFGANAQSGTEQVNQHFEESFVGIGEAMQILASGWSETMNSFGANAESGAEQILDALTSAMDEIISAADDMLGEWSSVMDDMVSAAEDAAEDIESALAGIPDEEVVIHYRTTGSTKPPGSAHGYEGVVHKPTLFMAGEAGPERVSVQRAGSSRDFGGGGGGASTIHIHQHLLTREIVNTLNIEKGRMISRMGT